MGVCVSRVIYRIIIGFSQSHEKSPLPVSSHINKKSLTVYLPLPLPYLFRLFVKGFAVDEVGRVVKASEMNEEDEEKDDFDFEDEEEKKEEEGQRAFKDDGNVDDNNDKDGDDKGNDDDNEVKNGDFESGGLGIDESALLPPPWEVAST